MKYSKLSIVIPAYNEEKTIEYVVDKLLEIPLKIQREIVIVEDGSSDKTWAVLQKYAGNPVIKLMKNAKNSGKTFTVKKGVLSSTGDIVVIQDADLEYEPADLPKMVNYFTYMKDIDVLYGNRFHKGNLDKGMNYLGNLFLTFISNIFTAQKGFKVNDMEVCYKMGKGEIFRSLAAGLESDRFGLEPEITAKFAKLGAKVVNVDIIYRPRDMKAGKKLKPIYDGLKALIQILKYNIELPVKPKVEVKYPQ